MENARFQRDYLMTKYRVHCTKLLANTKKAWAFIRDFAADWHPSIVTSQLHYDAYGALVRVFCRSDGSSYREHVTCFGDTDCQRRYATTDGIEGVTIYQSEAVCLKNAANWSASFEALKNVGETVAEGTSAVFDNELDCLAANEYVDTVSDPAKPSGKAKLHRIQIQGAPRLSVLSAIPQDQPCSTLVLFLHGIGGNASNWQSQLEALGQTYPVAALDFRGYGQSTLGSSQTLIDDHCDDILRVMKNFGASKLVIVGLSMGSWIATSFAMRHPQLLTALVLAGGCTGMSEANADERARFLVSRAIPISLGKTPAEFADGVVQLLAGPNAKPDVCNVLHASMSAISRETYLDASTCFCNPIERFDFSRIACPVLLLTGEHDRLAPPEEIRQVSLSMHDAIYDAGRLPDICFEVISDTGHLCNLEQPEVFNNQLHRFLKRMLLS